MDRHRHGNVPFPTTIPTHVVRFYFVAVLCRPDEFSIVWFAMRFILCNVGTATLGADQSFIATLVTPFIF